MKIKGEDLKRIIGQGLDRYDQHLTLNLSKAFMDFSDQINTAKEYELFSVVSILALRANEDGAPIIAELMKGVNREDLETMDQDLVSSIGYFMNDHFKGQKALSVFQSSAPVQNEHARYPLEKPKPLRPISDQEQHQSEHH